MDSNIDSASETANDFGVFFRHHRGITHVVFNGAKAEACFRRHVLRTIGVRNLSYIRLPSTSPANASMTYEQKLNAWRAGIRGKNT